MSGTLVLDDATLSGIASTLQYAGDNYPYDIRRYKHQDGKPVTQAGISVIGGGATSHVRLFRQDPQTPDEVTVLAADELRALLGRVFATGSW